MQFFCDMDVERKCRHCNGCDVRKCEVFTPCDQIWLPSECFAKTNINDHDFELPSSHLCPHAKPNCEPLLIGINSPGTFD